MVALIRFVASALLWRAATEQAQVVLGFAAVGVEELTLAKDLVEFQGDPTATDIDPSQVSSTTTATTTPTTTQTKRADGKLEVGDDVYFYGDDTFSSNCEAWTNGLKGRIISPFTSCPGTGGVDGIPVQFDNLQAKDCCKTEDLSTTVLPDPGGFSRGQQVYYYGSNYVYPAPAGDRVYNGMPGIVRGPAVRFRGALMVMFQGNIVTGVFPPWMLSTKNLTMPDGFSRRQIVVYVGQGLDLVGGNKLISGMPCMVEGPGILEGTIRVNVGRIEAGRLVVLGNVALRPGEIRFLPSTSTATTSTRTSSTSTATTSTTTSSTTATTSSSSTASTTTSGGAVGIIVGLVVAASAVLGCILCRLQRRDDGRGSDGIEMQTSTRAQFGNPVVSNTVSVLGEHGRHTELGGSFGLERCILLSGRFDGGHKEHMIRSVYQKIRQNNGDLNPYIVEACPGVTYGGQTNIGLASMEILVPLCFDDYGQKTGSVYSSFEELQYAHQYKIPILPVRFGTSWPPRGGSPEGYAQNRMVFKPDVVYIDFSKQSDPDPSEVADTIANAVRGFRRALVT